MSREIRPLDLDALERRLYKVQSNLKALMEPRLPANYLGTRGALVTLKIARREIGYAIEVLKTAGNTIADAREDSGAFKLT